MYFNYLKTVIQNRPSKFKGLFLSLLALFLLQPFLPDTALREAIVTFSIMVILITSIYAIGDEKQKYVTVSVILAVPALVFSIITYLTNDIGFLQVNYLIKIVFWIWVTYVSLYHVLRTEVADDDTIYGSICVYLQLGLCWAHIYTLIESLSPGSFSGLAQDYSHAEYANNALRDFIYHSFVTLTTLGNGDITPVSMAARTFAMLEAIIGQVYLTVLVGRIIGLYIKNK